MDTVHGDQYTFMIISHSILLRMRKLQTKVVEKIKTQILSLTTFSFNLVEKYRARQAKDDNMSHTHCMPDN